jgi:hypothetical protein
MEDAMVRFMKGFWPACLLAILGLAIAGCEGSSGPSKGSPDPKAMKEQQEKKQKEMEEKQGQYKKAMGGGADKEKGKAEDKSKAEDKGKEETKKDK